MSTPPCPCRIEGCVLCEANMFSGLSDEHVCQIRGLINKHSYRVHEVLFREGEPANRLFLISSGQVKLSTSLPDGREQILQLGVAGHLLGVEALNMGTHPYTATAIVPVDVCTIQHRDMMRILEKNPKVSLRVIRTLTEELEQAQALIRDLGLKSATEKVASFVLSLVPVRGPANNVHMALSRQEIAEMLGLTVETVSRVMAELRREGIILAPRGEIRILNQERLQELAGITMLSGDDGRRYPQVN